METVLMLPKTLKRIDQNLNNEVLINTNGGSRASRTSTSAVPFTLDGQGRYVD